MCARTHPAVKEDMKDAVGHDNERPRGAIVVVAKCPIPGKCKTRLGPLLGEEGAALLARALLSDVLVALSESSQLDSVLKVLLYAPGNEEGLNIMMNIVVQSLKLDEWTLLPVLTTDLQSCNVGTVLADALQRTRALLKNNHESVVFLGMDAPELPLDEIITALAHPTLAVLCPASDGGYGMLSVPPHAPCPRIFQNIPWSQSLTALSQLKALTDCNVDVRLGRLMHDMDEAEDVNKLAQRLCRARSGNVDLEGNNNNVLWMSSGLSRLPPTTGTCDHTWNALVSIGLIERTVADGVPKYGIRKDTFTQR